MAKQKSLPVAVVVVSVLQKFFFKLKQIHNYKQRHNTFHSMVYHNVINLITSTCNSELLLIYIVTWLLSSTLMPKDT